MLAFDGHFSIPLNYWTHSNDKRNGFPVLTNEQPIVLALQVEIPRNNTNVVSYAKNLTNRLSQIVNGSNVVTNHDTIQATANFVFTKTQYDPLPKSLRTQLQHLRQSLEATTIAAKHLTN